jgi:hypothetical protein
MFRSVKLRRAFESFVIVSIVCVFVCWWSHCCCSILADSYIPDLGLVWGTVSCDSSLAASELELVATCLSSHDGEGESLVGV